MAAWKSVLDSTVTTHEILLYFLMLSSVMPRRWLFEEDYPLSLTGKEMQQDIIKHITA